MVVTRCNAGALQCNTCATHVQHNCNIEKELESEKKKEIDLNQEKINQKKKSAPIKAKKI